MAKKTMTDFYIVPLPRDPGCVFVNQVITKPKSGGQPLVVPAYSAKQAVGYFLYRILGIERKKALDEKMKQYEAVPVDEVIEDSAKPKHFWIIPRNPEHPETVDLSKKIKSPEGKGPLVIEAYSGRQAIGFYVAKLCHVTESEKRKALMDQYFAVIPQPKQGE